MGQPSNDPSIQNEPHLAKPEIRLEALDAPLCIQKKVRDFDNRSSEDVEHTVWDEPALAIDLVGQPSDTDLKYSNWLAERQNSWSQWKAWGATLLIALFSGPWALLLVLLHGFDFNRNNVVMICIFAPLTQEVCKNAIALWVVEKRPYYFTGWFQIFFCAMASATIFVTIWNLATGFMIAAPTDAEFAIQWTLFLFMHLVTSTLAGTGLEKIWRRAVVLREQPRLEHGSRWFMAAFGVHVAYAIVAYVVVFVVKYVL